ncbi:pyroglutamyl-peptidase I [Luteimonas sp. RD2P54]|uniref:Pyrrolidone-carboxylate peptidase n=1 Tax=Luteimonas endophytica TaxID=3042023 RepID=A0ABT6JBX9_9GAMM|nr:pyroglutamyl-peptidase I [Luteimonas endophytica]MDH5824269.1 pyroglutamyl-peptidase I [Luteimonas endophytica]
MPTVLLTGFAPFGGEAVNPSWQAVASLQGARIAGHRVVARELPVEFGTSLRALRAAIREVVPALVLCVGQAGGRARLSLERVAINVDDARIPDNAGARPVDCAVVADGPAAYFATLPIKAMLAALGEAGIPAEVSQSAGTYVCNHVFYGLMHALRARRVRGGFIHIPYSPEQAARHPGAPSMAVETVVAGLRVALRTALATGADLRVSAGAEH